jgi:sugar lactone lactonase YvrE
MAKELDDVRIPPPFLSQVGRWIPFALATLMLTACGGGSSSGGGGGGGGGTGATTYSVGGTITGLTGSGLTLADNGGDTLSVPSGASTFTFATKLQSGAGYDVTVAAQPIGDECQVSAASGTVSANVTSVAVACTAASFTISGSITGLTAAGLQLQYYAGGEVLAVPTAAASFAFTQPVPANTPVKMAVAAQPGFQICTPGASNFSGPITANITADTLSCAAATATVSLFAGSPSGASGSANGTGTAATFNGPVGIAVDAAGNLYVADYSNNEIRKITPAGVVSLFAGSPTGAAGSADGTGTAATFHSPIGVAIDSAGNLFVADENNNEIREITPAGVVTTFAGSTTAGHADGTGTAASFAGPEGIAVDASGNVWVADTGNNEIRKITPSGQVTTWAGSYLASGNANGSGASATFNMPIGIAVDGSGNVYVVDRSNNEIRKIDATDVVSLFAGSPAGTAGSADGTGSAATFNAPFGITLDSAGNLYVTDANNQLVRMLTPNALVTTLAGSATNTGTANGTGSAALFNYPFGIVAAASGELFVGDFGNNEIRKLVP